MCDKLVFDLSQEVEGSPNVFIRKDWINILDNQNQNYQNNQSIIDTSQLSNSNKYMGYREAYLAVPLTLSLITPNTVNKSIEPTTALNNVVVNQPLSVAGNADYAIGLKNWFGTIIHSFTLDYNGTTIVQQTPFCNMWNSFKLLTTLSYSDIKTQGSTIGFYPDTSSSWVFNQYTAAAGGATYGLPAVGKFVCNNSLSIAENSFNNISSAVYNTPSSVNNPSFPTIGGNYGLTKRISWINYNPTVMSPLSTATYGALPVGGGANSSFVGISTTFAQQAWKSYISYQRNAVAPNVNGAMVISVMATIYLKHIHNFFNMIPLLKGVFMKMTMNLNNCSSTITVGASPGLAAPLNVPLINTYITTVPVGGVCPLLIPSGNTGSNNVFATAGAAAVPCLATAGDYIYNISVGSIILNNTIQQSVPAGTGGTLSKSIYLYVPAYTFNPVFEQAYLSNPIKQVKYTDIYQYQVQNITPTMQFNNLITNGIANIKSVLIIPFYSIDNTNIQGGGANFTLPGPQYQSPFDPAGTGCTAPMVTLGNFNIQISGQNAIYNTQRYTFEEFNNQLYGQNAVNGGLTDGLTSGLIGYQDFLQSYCYYYVNVERMLPVEQSVPKSVQILGTNYSSQKIDLWVFIEYGVEINIDLQTGARV
jgi:hypothetical protein